MLRPLENPTDRLEDVNYTFNIRSFMDPILGMPMTTGTKLKASQWVNVIRMNAYAFSDAVKNKFCIPLLDMVGGFLLETRFRDMPMEILEYIFGYLSTRELESIKKVSKVFHLMAKETYRRRTRSRS